MKYQETVDLYRLAIMQDPSVVTDMAGIQSHPGRTLAEFNHLGLEKKHLSRLEKLGLAIRAYTKNIWTMGETLPEKEYVVKPGESFRGKGHVAKWILLRRENAL